MNPQNARTSNDRSFYRGFSAAMRMSTTPMKPRVTWESVEAALFSAGSRAKVEMIDPANKRVKLTGSAFELHIAKGTCSELGLEVVT